MFVGDECSVTCAPGYSITGSPKTVSCDVNAAGTVGFWDMSSGDHTAPVPPTCEANTCTFNMPSVLGLSHDCGGKRTGETCTATANPGYSGGPFSLQCDASGSITGPELSVQPQACPVPAFGQHVSSSCASKTIGMTCWTYCDAGTSGSMKQYECQATGAGPELVALNGATQCRPARRLGPAPRRLAACDQASVDAAGLDVQGVYHNCLGVAEGGICVAECAYGYSITREPSLKLCQSGAFQTVGAQTMPTCTPNLCSLSYPSALGVGHDCAVKRTDETCTADCSLTGYTYASGGTPQTFTCTATAEFSGANPACALAPCQASQLTLSAEYRHSCGSVAFQEDCLVDCAKGWSLNGTAELYRCLASGLLSGTPPTCEAKTCTDGVPVDADLNATGCSALTTGQSCTVACVAGYTGPGSIFTCSSSGSLTGVRPTCTARICPSYTPAVEGSGGTCSSVPFGSTCSVGCESGYTLQEGTSVQQFRCEWDGPSQAVTLQGTPPQCNAVPCAYGIPSSRAVVHNCSGATTGASCIVGCAEGYEGNTESFTCQSSGVLSGVLPTCTPLMCSTSHLQASILHTCAGVTFGSPCFARCIDGYSTPNGAEQYTCGVISTSSTWTVSLLGDDPECSPNACIYNAPVGIQYTHNCSGAVTGATCLVECAEQWVGSSEIFECQASGAFSGRLPTCLIVTTTRTTTTSTTTTPPDPHLARAAFGASFSQVVLTFSDAVCMAGQPCPADELEVSCGALLTDGVLATLGDSPRCVWSSDHGSMYVVLGTGATVEPGDLLLTSAGALSSASRAKVLGSLNATIQRGDDAGAVSAVLIATPPETSTCGRVEFFGAASTGAYGRALRFAWSIGSQTPTSARLQLQATLDAAGEGASLVVPAQQLFDAFSGLGSGGGPWLLEVELEVSNWLGQAAVASASVAILAGAPGWQAVAAPAASSFESFEAVRLAVRLLPPGTCTGAAAPSSTAQLPNISWSYQADGEAEWRSLQAAALVDTSMSPAVVELAPFSFGPGTSHAFRAVVGSASPVTFPLHVRERPPLAVLVTGPRQVSPSCSFTLDASASADPSHDPALGAAALGFAWTCTPTSGTTPCGDLANSMAGPTLQVDGRALGAGSYVFTVTVSTAAGRQGNASWLVALTSGAPPPITIATPWSDSERVSVGAGLPRRVSASLQQSADCAVQATWTWQWAFVDVAAGTMTRLLTEPSSNLSAVSDSLNTALIPGGEYAYAVLGTADTSVLQQLTLPSSLENALVTGIFVILSATFFADAPPSPGFVQVTPLYGEALTTSFTVATGSWSDEDPSQLSYALYVIKVADNVAMSFSNGTVTCSPECALPEVEWQNHSSPHHWTKLGASMLRSWSAVGAPSGGVVLPPGGHLMVVRVRDAAGGSGTAFVRGPLVSQAQGAITLQIAEQALTRAGYDSQALLDTVEALTSSGYSAEQQTAVVQAMLGALESASSTTDIHSMHRFSQVVKSTVLSAGTGAALDILMRSAGILSTVVARARPSVGVGSGTSLDVAAGGILECAHAIGYSYVDSNSSVAEDGAALGDELTNSLSMLASKLAAEARSGESLQFSSSRGQSASETVTLAVAKEPLAALAAGKGFFGGDVVLTGNPVAGRRLSTVCGTITVEQTGWRNCNLYSKLNSSSLIIQQETELKVVRVQACGLPVELVQPVQLSLSMPAWPATTSASSVEPICVRYDREALAWSEQGVGVVGAVTESNATLACLSVHSNGTYTVAFRNISLPPPLALPGASEDAKAGNVVLATVLVLLTVCGGTAAVGLGLAYKRKKRFLRKNVEAGLDMEVQEWEHDGIGTLPHQDAVTVRHPQNPTDTNRHPEALETEFEEEEEEEEPEVGIFMNVGRDTVMRRRFAL